VATKLGYAITAIGVLVGAVAVGAAWASGARREARPPPAIHPASGASDARVAALESRLTNIERTLALLAARGHRETDTRVADSQEAPAVPEASSEVTADDQEPPVPPEVALNTLYTSLDRRLEAERPDPAWRPERDIEASLRSLPAPPNVLSTSCISTFCKVELKHRTLADSDASGEPIARLPHFAAGTLYRQDPADPLRQTLYVQRPGYLFDKEAALAPPIQP
jgi:hypothetical protein